jgi:Tfp pilus assembly major pilin PilA
LVVNATIVGAMVIIGVLTKIIAIPAVNKWLTKFGAGSVPKSAVSN